MSDNSTAIDFDAPCDADEFLSPEDIVGDDLAAELQKVLDEAKTQLAVDLTSPQAARVAPPTAVFQASPPAATTPKTEAGPESDADFESPDELLGAFASPAATAHPLVEESAEGFEQQLKGLLDSIASGEAGGAAPSVDATVAKAQGLTKEVEQMTAMVQNALAAPAASSQATLEDSPTFSEEEVAKMAAEISDPAPQKPVSAEIKNLAATEPKQPAPPAQSLSQLDEYLAGHADHAVSDAFETVSDVVAQDQAAGSTPGPTIPVPVAPPAEAEDDFSSPEQVLDTQTLTVPVAAQPVAATAPVAEKNAPVHAPAPASAAAVDPAAPVVKPRRKLNIGGLLRSVVAVSGKLPRRVCSVLNRPLNNASESTRKTIGYVGLLTVAHGSLLILGKMLFSLMG